MKASLLRAALACALVPLTCMTWLTASAQPVQDRVIKVTK